MSKNNLCYQNSKPSVYLRKHLSHWRKNDLKNHLLSKNRQYLSCWKEPKTSSDKRRQELVKQQHSRCQLSKLSLSVNRMYKLSYWLRLENLQYKLLKRCNLSNEAMEYSVCFLSMEDNLCPYSSEHSEMVWMLL